MILALLLACGLAEEDFPPAYADAWCDVVWACADAAARAAMGLDDLATCRERVAEGLTALGGEGRYDARTAEDCVAAVEALDCAGYAEGVPEVCATVWE